MLARRISIIANSKRNQYLWNLLYGLGVPISLVIVDSLFNHNEDDDINRHTIRIPLDFNHLFLLNLITLYTAHVCTIHSVHTQLSVV